MENLKYEGFITESQRKHIEYRIERLKRDIMESRRRLRRDVRNLRDKNHDYVGRVRKQIIELQTQIQKLD